MVNLEHLETDMDSTIPSNNPSDFEPHEIDPEIQDKIEFGDDIRGMIYGQSGAGKTELLSTLIDDPRTAPLIWLDIESGLRGIKSKVRIIENIRDLGNPVEGKIDVLRIREWGQMQRVYDFLFERRYIDKKLAYKALVMDSITEINQLSLNHANNTSGTVKIDPKKAGFDEFRKTNTMMKDMIRALRDIEGMHVFYSALPQFKQEDPKDENSRVWIKPALIGQLSDQAVALVDYVGYLRVGPGGKRIIQFQQDPKVFAKERSEKDKLIKTIEAASSSDFITMTRVLNAMLK